MEAMYCTFWMLREAFCMQAVALCWNRSWHWDCGFWHVAIATRVANVATAEISATAIH